MTTKELQELLGKVTPGEWVVEAGLGDLKIASPPTVGYLAKVFPSSWDTKEDENLSNAALIALAPALARRVIELEEALVELSGIIDSHYVQTEHEKRRIRDATMILEKPIC